MISSFLLGTGAIILFGPLVLICAAITLGVIVVPSAIVAVILLLDMIFGSGTAFQMPGLLTAAAQALSNLI